VLKEAPEGALKAFEKAIEINPEFALAFNGRGCVHFGFGKFDDAIQDFRQKHGFFLSSETICRIDITSP